MIAAALALLAPLQFRGGDVSFLPQMEAAGARYFEQNAPSDPLRIMSRHGWNLARLRLWVEPREGWCDLGHTLQMAKRIKAAGMQLLLDLHYADDWADPGKQPKPRSWSELHGWALVRKVESYTMEVVGALVKQGTPPAVVQVGNEIIAGMLWPDGRVDYKSEKSWDPFCDLLKAGLRGVRRVAPGAETMVHIDRGANWDSTRIFFDHLRERKVDFDLIGQSYYPWWHGTLEKVRDNLARTSERYGKGIVIVETAYPFSLDKMSGHPHMVDERFTPQLSYPATPAGQLAFTQALVRVVKETPRGLGRGVVWWAPDWIGPKEGTVWENLALFNSEGRPLPALEALAK